jgi:Heat induced stress protein YflT
LPRNGAALDTGRTVVALFSHSERAHAAIQDLRQAGFALEQIGIAMQDQSREALPAASGAESKEQEATVGAITGGVIGSLLGLISSLLIPGIGPILVGGVMASLVGAGVGATTGGIVGALAGAGVPEHDARYFDAGLRAGATLVTVNVGARLGDALDILQRHEADLGIGRERRVAGTQPYTGPERRLARV